MVPAEANAVAALGVKDVFLGSRFVEECLNYFYILACLSG